MIQFEGKYFKKQEEFLVPIKILFSDLDGTLVEHGGDITTETMDAVNRLKEAEIDLILVSGRHADMMKSIHSKLNLKTPVIGCNGGMIKNLTTKTLLDAKELSQEIIQKTISIARTLSVDWVVYEQNHIFYEQMPPLSYKLPYINDKLPEDLRSNFVHVQTLDEMFQKEPVFLKILLLFDKNMEALEEGKQLLNQLEGVHVLRSANSYLDVMSVGTSKGNAIKMYLEKLNIPRESVAAIGDAQNDIDMIEYAGLGMAMGNAVEPVKEVAQFVTGHVPIGFLEAVEHLIRYNQFM
jgi:Cof subfamily protein (haloacid dehalogenase superfamily)